ncbi:virulence protein RhuM/Fic/DOC family protein [Patescibacteria group bacterium]|nr:virulence protein RhuM/Fic/DOC family protein [Patescibacteria group bacterium]MBU1246934.1 virulence protein RhuM/Fic/DOC family protein [Patescibacteria group bacterium]MBU2010281.1 virulence protein RhuM/Fic/DOC family protein [Patescibacteria group bacterium]MBU2416672.1 virulence protein RhuM/Fic/DOC family protein [Patescibacteria group bacterium]MBU2460719.1 virulence protein RhuM/Fic/DOC family protein [Patescibacteria group bacterium]
MKNENLNQNQIIIYKSKDGDISLEVNLREETIWLDAHQMARIFNVNRPAIVKHINNIYQTGELNQKATCSILEQVAADGKSRKMNLYNLDMIISVGYRVNSQRATQFRIWATKTLKQHILSGYTINQKRLSEANEKFKELQNAIDFLRKKTQQNTLRGQEKEILNLLADYSKTFFILGQYDKGTLRKLKGKKARFILCYENCVGVIVEIKKKLMEQKNTNDFFGKEPANKFEAIIKNLYQTFDSKELYKTIEEKAAHLLYFTIKDHPFIDGNKRVGSFLFVYFLDKNNYLYRKTGERKINDNALVALALLIAESDPKEKDVLIKIIINLICS